jgi:DNA invertase Pin-like site-specific DNA recombinase
MNEYVIAKYIRLSRDEAVSDSLSISNQRLLLDKQIEELDIPYTTVLEFVDNDYTGTNLERPAAQEMLELVRCGRVNCIITKDFSRFSRNAMESGYYIEQVFPLYRVRFIAIGDYFDSNDQIDGTGGIDVAFKFLMHEHYSKDLSKKVKTAKRTLMERGEHIVGGAIYGYRKADGKWEIDPVVADVVREIFSMALNGKTTAQIRNKLFADRRLAPREYEYTNKGKEIAPKFNWTTRQIWRILQNEQYTGSYVAGKRETSQIGDGFQIEHDRTKWIIRPDSHPAIISKEDFAKVQEILKNPKQYATDKPTPSKHADILRSRIVSGERKSCAVPYGYIVNNGVWTINPVTADVVREIYEMTLNGLSLKDICDKLRESKIPTLSESRRIIKGEDITPTCHWKTQAVKDILKDEQYLGLRIAGKSYQDVYGNKYHRPKNEWIVTPNHHPAIISKDVFDEVQKIRANVRKNIQRRDYLLIGKVACGCCEYALSYGESVNPPIYYCPRTHADPTADCHKMKCSSVELEGAVMAMIRKQAEVVLGSGDLSEIHKKGDFKRKTADCEKQINLLLERRQNIYEQFVLNEINCDDYTAQKNECSVQIERLNNQLAILKQAERDKSANEKVSVIAKTALSETATPKDVVNALVEKVLVFPNNRIEIRWKFANFTG